VSALKEQKELRPALSKIPGKLTQFLKNDPKFRLKQIKSEWFVSLTSAQPVKPVEQAPPAVPKPSRVPAPIPVPVVKALGPASAPKTPISVPVAAKAIPAPAPAPVPKMPVPVSTPAPVHSIKPAANQPQSQALDQNEKIVQAISNFLQTTNGGWFPLHSLKSQSTLKTILNDVQGLQRLLKMYPNKFECRTLKTESQVRVIQSTVPQSKHQPLQPIPQSTPQIPSQMPHQIPSASPATSSVTIPQTLPLSSTAIGISQLFPLLTLLNSTRESKQWKSLPHATHHDAEIHNCLQEWVMSQLQEQLGHILELRVKEDRESVGNLQLEMRFKGI
jgi:hypothetical protein